MKLEMEGKEPLVIFFGVPICTAAIVLGTLFVSPPKFVQPVYQPSDVKVTSEVKATLPEGSIQIQNNVPPVQIREVEREVVREVVKVPDVVVKNDVRTPPPVVKVIQKGKTAEKEPIEAVDEALPPPLGTKAREEWDRQRKSQ